MDTHGTTLATHNPVSSIIGNKCNPLITLDSAGMIYFAYEIVTEIEHCDLYITKIDENGEMLWTTIRNDNSLNITTNSHKSIITDSFCNVYVAYNAYVSPEVGYNCVLLKINPSGEFIWIKENIFIAPIDVNNHVSIAIDHDNNIYLTYQNTNSCNNDHNHLLMNDIVLCKLDENGGLIWLCQQPMWNTIEYEAQPCISVDSCGNIYIVYNSEKTNHDQIDLEEYKLILFKVDVSGHVQWVKQYPSLCRTDSIFFPRISIDQLDDIYITYECLLDKSNNICVSIYKINGNGETIYTLPNHLLVMSHEIVFPEIKIDCAGHIYVLCGQTIKRSNYLSERTLTLSKYLPPMEYSPSVSIDPDNNIYYAYYTNGIHTGNANLTGYDVVVTKKDKHGNTLWCVRDSVFNTDKDSSHPVVVAHATSCYVIYHTLGLTSGSSITGTQDIVVMNLDKNGHIIWVKQQPTFNTVKKNEMPTADIDLKNNLYVAYQSTDQSDQRRDIVIFKMGQDGRLKWVRRGINKYQDNWSPTLKCDKQNDVIYVAYVNNDNLHYNQTAGYSDIVLIKLDLDGEFCMNVYGQSWSIQQTILNTNLTDIDPSICLDGVGNIYVCYITNGAVSGCTNSGNYDLVICKLNSDGCVIKIAQNDLFNTYNNETHPSISYHAGHLYIAYETSGSISGQDRVGRTDIVVMKMNALTFEIVWIHQKFKINTALDNLNPQITVDNEGTSYLVYETSGTIIGQIYSGQGTKILLSKINKNGLIEWIRR
jgi:hypothetical protein